MRSNDRLGFNMQSYTHCFLIFDAKSRRLFNSSHRFHIFYFSFHVLLQTKFAEIAHQFRPFCRPISPILQRLKNPSQYQEIIIIILY